VEKPFSLAPIFSDGAVLQRGEPVKIFGAGAENAAVEVSLSSMDRPVCARVRDGRWCACLPPLPAAEGLTLTASSRGQTLTVQDVAVGEVWIAGGQSNMEFWLRNEAERDTVIPAANDPLLRFFDMPRISYEGQQKELSFADYGLWRPFTPEHAGWFSAVGAYFGMQLRQALKVPVAIVGCNCGATSASCWLREEYLRAVPALRVYEKTYAQTLETLDLGQYTLDFKERQAWGQTPQMAEFDCRMARGEVSPEELKKRLEGLTPRQRQLLMLPCGPLAPTRPFALYHNMVEKLAPYTAKGVIWYQGEADTIWADHYAELFGQVVRCWRAAWGKELAFLTVQLAPFRQWLSDSGERFPEVRAQQELACRQLPGVWMASIMDAGMETDIHPKNKRIPGERLALLARGKVYGEDDLLCEPPAVKRVNWEGGEISILFERAGAGLQAKEGFPQELKVTSGAETVPFQASIKGDCVTLRLPEDAFPSLDLQYAWQSYVRASLYNSGGLCAKPFMIHLETDRYETRP